MEKVEDEEECISLNQDQFVSTNPLIPTLPGKFECNICLQVVLVPVECVTCDSIYCQQCISKYKDVCPNRCGSSFKKINRHLLNELNELQFKCFHEKCSEVVKYEYYTTHSQNCPSQQCPSELCQKQIKGLKNDFKLLKVEDSKKAVEIKELKDQNFALRMEVQNSGEGGLHEQPLPEGSVKKEYPDGNIYDGKMKGGRRDGFGRQVYANADTYEGEWKDDKRNGFGRLFNAKGDHYAGEFSEDKKQGTGKQRLANGDVYTGEHLNNLRHGKGNYIWADGKKYNGEWIQNVQQGRGFFTWVDNQKHFGYWLKGIQHGIGIYYSIAGVASKGEWKNGQFNRHLTDSEFKELDQYCYFA